MSSCQSQVKQSQVKQSQQCQAHEYGDCYLRTEEYDVTFKYRDGKGRHHADEIVKVCMCQNHYNWLCKIHKDEPLEMRGEAPQYAIHDDLFSHFAAKKRMYTLMKVDGEEEQYHLFNGRDVKAMRKVIQEWFPNKDHYIRSYEEGFFQTTFHYNADLKDGEEVVIEVKYITEELAIAALANGLSCVHMMTPEGKLVNISESVCTFIPRADTDPLYVSQPIPEVFQRFFTKKQEAHIFGDFEECVEFIEDEIDKSVINWSKVRETSPHTKTALFEKSQQLMHALQRNDEEHVMNMQEAGDLTPDVLWVTYVTVNHRLFASYDPKKNLTEKKALVELFVAQGLEKDLLVLAISGERERDLFVKRRAHYNILRENEFVVKYLVPRVISGSDIIYKSEYTPLTYWQTYDNTTSYMGGCFNPGYNNRETFEKNDNIRLYLESQSIGKLDPNVLSAEALPLYKQVKANGHHDAEFVICGYQQLFEYRPISTVDGFRRCTVEEGAKIFPGITEIYEEKKRKLRAGDYAEWKKMNETLLKYKNE